MRKLLPAIGGLALFRPLQPNLQRIGNGARRVLRNRREPSGALDAIRGAAWISLTVGLILALGVLAASSDDVSAQQASNDADLRTLAVSPDDIVGFTRTRTYYEVGVASTVTTATVFARRSNNGATMVFQDENDVELPDADTTAPEHQVSLSAGRNPVNIVVTAQDGVTTKAYTVIINRGVTTDFGWWAVDDFDGLVAAGNEGPTGIWSDGITMWVADIADDKIYAYKLSSGNRDSAQDFDTLIAAGNRDAGGIWSDRETMWVSDAVDAKIYAYKMSDGSRDSAKDINDLAAEGNGLPRGIWSDGDTMWVADSSDNKLYAYKMNPGMTDHGDRDSAKDFNGLNAASNNNPRGIWSDGETMWVADWAHRHLFAYKMNPGETDHGDRDSAKDFTNLLRLDSYSRPVGIWSDGLTMWMASDRIHGSGIPSEPVNDKIYSFNMPVHASLSSLRVSPENIIDFEMDRTGYQVGVASTVTTASVFARARFRRSTVEFQNADGTAATDADSTAAGHQVTLSAGRNPLNIVVIGAHSSTTYSVSINRGVVTRYGWKAVDDMDGLFGAGNDSPGHIWSNGETIWVADEGHNKLFAYKMSNKRRDPDKDFDPSVVTGFGQPRGIWSDGETIWVADLTNRKIYAYNLNTKARIPGRDFDTLDTADNDNPQGIWSDGNTMWVADSVDKKIYAYKMSDQSRDSGKDFDSLDTADNDNPQGIWSDGATMWVADSVDKKIYAGSVCL